MSWTKAGTDLHTTSSHRDTLFSIRALKRDRQKEAEGKDERDNQMHAH